MRANHIDPVTPIPTVSDNTTGVRATGGVDRDLDQARARIDELETALQTSRRIGMAIGIVMITYRITDVEAFNTLVKLSQHANRKLRDIADDIVFTGDVGIGRTPGS